MEKNSRSELASAKKNASISGLSEDFVGVVVRVGIGGEGCPSITF